MRPAKSSQELLWNVSALAMHDTRHTREFVFERAANFVVKHSRENEETTTSNLLRNLGFLGQKMGVRAVQHTRPLEGGRMKGNKQTIVPSGADLELAVEVSPGRWLDLLLQAKTLKPSGTYDGWKPDQNKKLISWAANNGRVPGMLLYNDLVPPFIKTAPPKNVPDYECDAFGACLRGTRTQMGWWGSRYGHGPMRTPSGISLCLDQAQMKAAAVPVTSMRKSHFQLEHLLHLGEHKNPVDAAGTTLRQLTTVGPPSWAVELLEARVATDLDVNPSADADAADAPIAEVELSARASVVVPFSSGPLNPVSRALSVAKNSIR